MELIKSNLQENTEEIVLTKPQLEQVISELEYMQEMILKKDKELERLRKHLIDVEDIHTQELLLIQNQSIPQTQANNDKEVLEKLLSEKETLANELEEARLSINNLQAVIEHFENNEEIHRLEALLEVERKKIEELKIDQVFVSKIEKDLVSRNQLIDELNEEVNTLKINLATIKDAKEQKDADRLLDRTLLANLIFKFLIADGPQKRRELGLSEMSRNTSASLLDVYDKI
ncbi:hypothetical protein O9G_004786 [Rozella allomycis CSF55]|uniref:GRIP domain-containing protein n=1 Tax=Rozella allomycis (strain CSF55) TaxID=988480 RepID=A0A075B1W2_ROZAC|nr:hypothetical protein O9G_004786 [Rozella allomycis CSF55]|eukprot:EPZ36525.1 hypothetical protein O9G_004786 [Rozella allomycis CSF55]